MMCERLCQHTFIHSLLGPDSIVVDLGANHGEFSQQIINTLGCRVYAVEPVSNLFEQIRSSPRLKKFNYAISLTNQPISLNLFPNRCASVYRLPQESSVPITLVPGITFDVFLRQNEIQDIDLLKVDIEGSERELFMTIAPSQLERIGQITIEFHDFLFPETRVQVETIKRRVIDLGFYCLPFSRDNTDVLFVNKRKITLPTYLYLRVWLRNLKGWQRIVTRLCAPLP